MRTSVVLGAALLLGILVSGCSRQKCFKVRYDAFIAEYGELGKKQFDEFCEDKGYDRAYRWSVGTLFSDPGTICCEKDGILDP